MAGFDTTVSLNTLRNKVIIENVFFYFLMVLLLVYDQSSQAKRKN